jgi:hypothetical protein
VKNTECTIYITTRRGRAWKYRRDKDGWTQTGPTGKVHRLTAEQLLSHILPPLATGSRSRLTVRVKADRPKRPHGKSQVPGTKSQTSTKQRQAQDPKLQTPRPARGRQVMAPEPATRNPQLASCPRSSLLHPSSFILPPSSFLLLLSAATLPTGPVLTANSCPLV